MDASPLAQLNNRQQQIVLSPIEDISPLSQWEPPPQRQAFRHNSISNGQLSRHYSFQGTFSSKSTNNSSYTNASSVSSAGGASYFGLQRRNKPDLLSPMASL